MPGSALRILHVKVHLITSRTECDMFYHCAHCTDEKTRPREFKGSNLVRLRDCTLNTPYTYCL